MRKHWRWVLVGLVLIVALGVAGYFFIRQLCPPPEWAFWLPENYACVLH